MIRFLHLADLHLGSSFGYLSKEKEKIRQKDLFNALERAVDFAIDRKTQICGVLICGDLFDNIAPEDDLVYKTIKKLALLKENKIPTFLVPGTHDPSIYPDSVYQKYDFSILEILKDFDIPKPKTIEINGIKVYIYGFEYHPLYSKAPFGKFRRISEDGIHIAMIHGSVVSKGGDTKEEYVPLYPNDLKNTGMDYIALGHYHNFKEYRWGNVVGCYPGTLEGKTFKEKGTRFLTVLNISPQEVKIEKIPWNKKVIYDEVIDINKTTIENESHLEKYIRSLSTTPPQDTLLKVTLKGFSNLDIDIPTLQEKLFNEYFYIEIINETYSVNLDNLKNIAKERSVKGVFVKKMLQKLEQAEPEEKEILEMATTIVLKEMQSH